ncbi:alpha/beta-hydrolase [Wilcoxina mikolae CBS 423.85]|nr:alpha/beta-hydrolase [Wilcoxina mikolae CBS 423.85]
MRSHSRQSHQPHQPHSNGSTTLNLFIPSLHNATPLEACVTVPSSGSSTTTRKAAVFAHPYGPLGGTFHDPVVQNFRETLVSHGYIVAVFNFRGVGHSKGSTTWTGKAETGDYAAIAAWVINFSAALQSSDSDSDPPPKELQLVLGGYSYGGLIAAQCPPASSLLESLTSPPMEAFRAAITAGTKSAQQWYESHSDVGRTSYTGSRSPVVSPVRTTSNLSSSSSVPAPPLDPNVLDIITSYILVSPPLPPVSTFLLPSFSFSGSTESIVDPATAVARTGTRVLVVWGDEDVFTGVKKYRRWDEKMRKELGTERFESVEVGGVGHFWGHEGLEKVGAVVQTWLA